MLCEWRARGDNSTAANVDAAGEACSDAIAAVQGSRKLVDLEVDQRAMAASLFLRRAWATLAAKNPSWQRARYDVINAKQLLGWIDGGGPVGGASWAWGAGKGRSVGGKSRAADQPRDLPRAWAHRQRSPSRSAPRARSG